MTKSEVLEKMRADANEDGSFVVAYDSGAATGSMTVHLNVDGQFLGVFLTRVILAIPRKDRASFIEQVLERVIEGTTEEDLIIEEGL